MRHQIKQLIAAGIVLMTLSAAGTAQAAQSWGVAGEEEARFDAKVVDILCELTGDCPANCGDGKRQLGLLRADGVLILSTKNKTPFSGAAEELVDFCGKQVTADGIFTENHGVKVFALQFIREAPDGKWRGANRFLGKWAKANGEDPAAKNLNNWFRRDPRIKALIAKDGFLGLGQEADKKFLSEW